LSDGYIRCTACKQFFHKHDQEHGFERWGHGDPVQLINNPASWGSEDPTYRLLGFSKGDTQNKAMAEERKGRATFESIPFKGMRKRFPWLFKGLGLRDLNNPDELFLSSEKECQSGSIIKCSISARKTDGSYSYKLKDILDADDSSGGLVKKILHTCIKTHLSAERSGRSLILFGLDKRFISWCKDAFAEIYGGLKPIKPTTYRSDCLSWVHVAHPSSNQTDRQYQEWCEGRTFTPKVLWAREELAHRRRQNSG
jgi:hypothetical protein